MNKNIVKFSEFFDSDTITDLQQALKNSRESNKDIFINFMSEIIKDQNKKKIYEKFIFDQSEQVLDILKRETGESQIQKSIQLLIQRELSHDNEKKVTKVFTKKEVEEKKYQYYRKLKKSIENSDYQSFKELFKTEEIVYYYKEEYRYFPLEFNLTLELFNQLINARSNTNNKSPTDLFENLLKILWILLNNSYGSYLKTSIEHLKHLNQLYQSTLIPLNNRTNKEKFQRKSKQFQSELAELQGILNGSIFSNNNIKKCNIIIRKLIQICNLISNNKPFNKQTKFNSPNWVNAGDQFKVLFELIQNKIEIDCEDGKIKKITRYNKDNKEEYIKKLVELYDTVLRDKNLAEYNSYLSSLKKLIPTTNRNNYFFVYYKFFSYLLNLILSLLNNEQIDKIPAQKILKLIIELLLANNDYIQDRYKYILKIDLIKKELRKSVNTRIKLKKNGTKVSMENNNSEYTEYKKIFETGTPNEKLDKINGIELKKELKSIHGYYLFSLDEEKYDYHSLHKTFLEDWKRVKEIYDFLSKSFITYNIEKTIENISKNNLLKRLPLQLLQNDQTEQLRNETTAEHDAAEVGAAKGGNKIKYFKGPRNGVYYMKGKKKIYV